MFFLFINSVIYVHQVGFISVYVSSYDKNWFKWTLVGNKYMVWAQGPQSIPYKYTKRIPPHSLDLLKNKGSFSSFIFLISMGTGERRREAGEKGYTNQAPQATYLSPAYPLCSSCVGFFCVEQSSFPTQGLLHTLFLPSA